MFLAAYLNLVFHRTTCCSKVCHFMETDLLSVSNNLWLIKVASRSSILSKDSWLSLWCGQFPSNSNSFKFKSEMCINLFLILLHLWKWITKHFLLSYLLRSSQQAHGFSTACHYRWAWPWLTFLHAQLNYRWSRMWHLIFSQPKKATSHHLCLASLVAAC